MHTTPTHWILLGLGSLLLTACASQIPLNIREAPPGNPPPQQVRAKPDDFKAQPVRWGGEILQVDNRENSTWLTVLARPLADNGRPEGSDERLGRFLAKVPSFLDPKVYAEGRKVTVRGTLEGSETHQVGKFPYRYPVVAASDWYLWPKETPRPADNYPWNYDPLFYDPWFYDPWYPYYPYYYPPHLHRK